MPYTTSEKEPESFAAAALVVSARMAVARVSTAARCGSSAPYAVPPVVSDRRRGARVLSVDEADGAPVGENPGDERSAVRELGPVGVARCRGTPASRSPCCRCRRCCRRGGAGRSAASRRCSSTACRGWRSGSGPSPSPNFPRVVEAMTSSALRMSLHLVVASRAEGHLRESERGGLRGRRHVLELRTVPISARKVGPGLRSRFRESDLGSRLLRRGERGEESVRRRDDRRGRRTGVDVDGAAVSGGGTGIASRRGVGRRRVRGGFPRRRKPRSCRHRCRRSSPEARDCCNQEPGAKFESGDEGCMVPGRCPISSDSDLHATRRNSSAGWPHRPQSPSGNHRQVSALRARPAAPVTLLHRPAPGRRARRRRAARGWHRPSPAGASGRAPPRRRSSGAPSCALTVPADGQQIELVERPAPSPAGCARSAGGTTPAADR